MILLLSKIQYNHFVLASLENLGVQANVGKSNSSLQINMKNNHLSIIPKVLQCAITSKTTKKGKHC